MADGDVDSYEVAVEQYVYWREMGLSHAEMFLALGVRPPDYPVDAETTVRLLARCHREFTLRGAA